MCKFFGSWFLDSLGVFMVFIGVVNVEDEFILGLNLCLLMVVIKLLFNVLVLKWLLRWVFEGIFWLSFFCGVLIFLSELMFVVFEI